MSEKVLPSGIKIVDPPSNNEQTSVRMVEVSRGRMLAAFASIGLPTIEPAVGAYLDPYWKDGVRAAINGLTPASCPVNFRSQPNEHKTWHEGWLFATQYGFVAGLTAIKRNSL